MTIKRGGGVEEDEYKRSTTGQRIRILHTNNTDTSPNTREIKVKTNTIMMKNGYAASLEMAGQWQWAIYVLLHQPTSYLSVNAVWDMSLPRKAAILNILERHALHIQDSYPFGFSLALPLVCLSCCS